MVTIFNLRPKGLNIGNDVIAIGTRLLLSKAFGEPVNIITIPATAKYEAHRSAGLTAKTIYEINQCGHGVVVGGGNLYENGELTVDLDALQALSPPLMLFSLSRGRIYDRKGRLIRRTDSMPDRVVQALDRRASQNFARDTATFEYLRQIGSEKAVLGGCPTLFLSQLKGQLPEVAPSDRGVTLISVRNPQLMNIPISKQSAVHSDVNGIAAFLRERGHNVRLLCHDYRDIVFAASFDDLDYMYMEDPLQFLALLAACRLNVTYRLHSALPCLSFGVDCIPINYDERAISALETAAFGSWGIDVMQTADIPAAVAERVDALGHLRRLHEEAAPVWNGLERTLTEGFARFARDVIGYREQL